MPTIPIPLFTRSHKGVDQSVLVDDAAVQYNGYLDELQGLNIRPGEVLAINTALRSDGMFYWPEKNYVVCVDDAYVTLRSVSGETLVSAFSSALASFVAGTPIIFASNGTYTFMAGGGKINYVDAFGVVTELADADAPTTVTHVAFLDGYILAIDGTGRFRWSDVVTNTDWSALSFASAEGNPDNIQAMYVVQRQIYLLGTVTTEIWQNDGDTPFSRIPGGIIDMGCAAKYSPIKRDNSLLWLSHTRRVVEFTGTDVKFLSGRYDKEIAGFSNVSDCIGGLIIKDGQEFCVFHFPTEQRTLVYSHKAEDWSEWGNWDTGGMNWLPYDFRSTVYDIVTGKTFVGKERALAIACLSSDSTEDVTGAATTAPFKFLRRTGHINHGTSRKKRLEELRFTARRGSSRQSETPKLMFRYRNDGSSHWSNITEISLGAIGDTQHHVSLKRLGIYSSRQYEISATDSMTIALSNAEADVTVMR